MTGEVLVSWVAIIFELARIVEMGERFPGHNDPQDLENARNEIWRIGRHLNQLPPEHQLELPRRVWLSDAAERAGA